MITDFLDLPIPVDDLAAALRVVRAFRACESEQEYLSIPFAAWVKLEQLQEFLEHRVEHVPLHRDTLSYLRTARDG